MKPNDPKRGAAMASAAATAAGVTAAATLMYAPAAGATTDEAVSYAYGISARGLAEVPPTPYIESMGAPQHKNLVEASLPEGSDLKASAHLVNLHAKKDQAKVHIVDADVASGQLPQELEAMLPSSSGITAHVLKARCHKGEGSSKILKLEIGGQEIPPQGHGSKVEPNTTIAVPPGDQGEKLVEITLNKQVEHEDGSLTVTALQVKVLEGTAAGQVVNLAQAHCGPVAGGNGSPAPDPTPTESETTPPDDDKPTHENLPPAPAPDPVSGDFAVTG